MSGTALATITSDRKSNAGRPSDYRVEYCEAVIEYMSQGYSLTAFAGYIRQGRNTVYEWQKAHREFRDACNRAMSARTQALEKKLLSARRGGEVAAAIFALKNAAPADWREVRTTQHVHSVAQTLTDQDLYAIAAGQNTADGPIIDADFQHITPHANER